MASVTEAKAAQRQVENRKEWSSPQLKKFGVEEITANYNFGSKTDKTSTKS